MISESRLQIAHAVALCFLAGICDVIGEQSKSGCDRDVRSPQTDEYRGFEVLPRSPSGRGRWGESKLSYSIDKRAAETVIYCYLQTTSRQLPDFQAAPKPAYLPLSTEVPYQNSGTP